MSFERLFGESHESKALRRARSRVSSTVRPRTSQSFELLLESRRRSFVGDGRRLCRLISSSKRARFLLGLGRRALEVPRRLFRGTGRESAGSSYIFLDTLDIFRYTRYERHFSDA